MISTRILDDLLDLNHTLLSGQAFGWHKINGFWYGIAYGQVLKIRRDGDLLLYDASGDGNTHDLIRRYFRLDENLPKILEGFGDLDFFIQRAIARFKGLRLINQQPWECILSFLCSSHSNIGSINKMIHNLSVKFGERIEFDGMTFHTIPRPDALNQASINDLRACKVGYRASYIKKVAHEVSEGNVDINSLVDLDYDVARSKLLTLDRGHKIMRGVGPKVADCILLFSMGKNEAFPCDIWISRVVLSNYKHLLDSDLLASLSRSIKQKIPLSGGIYLKVGDVMRRYFGPNAGYAQLYLYALIRQEYGRNGRVNIQSGKRRSFREEEL